MVVPANSWNHFSRGIAQAPPGQRSKTNQNAWFWFVFVFVFFCFGLFYPKMVRGAGKGSQRCYVR